MSKQRKKKTAESANSAVGCKIDSAWLNRVQSELMHLLINAGHS